MGGQGGPMSSGGNRPVNSYKETEIIDGVTVDVKARVVTVKGKRGTLVRDFKHLNVEIYKKKNEKTGKDVIVVEKCSAPRRSWPRCARAARTSRACRWA